MLAFGKLDREPAAVHGRADVEDKLRVCEPERVHAGEEGWASKWRFLSLASPWVRVRWREGCVITACIWDKR